jgi:hypothetical protein
MEISREHQLRIAPTVSCREGLSYVLGFFALAYFMAGAVKIAGLKRAKASQEVRVSNLQANWQSAKTEAKRASIDSKIRTAVQHLRDIERVLHALRDMK